MTHDQTEFSHSAPIDQFQPTDFGQPNSGQNSGSFQPAETEESAGGWSENHPPNPALIETVSEPGYPESSPSQYPSTADAKTPEISWNPESTVTNPPIMVSHTNQQFESPSPTNASQHPPPNSQDSHDTTGSAAGHAVAGAVGNGTGNQFGQDGTPWTESLTEAETHQESDQDIDHQRTDQLHTQNSNPHGSGFAVDAHLLDPDRHQHMGSENLTDEGLDRVPRSYQPDQSIQSAPLLDYDFADSGHAPNGVTASNGRTQLDRIQDSIDFTRQAGDSQANAPQTEMRHIDAARQADEFGESAPPTTTAVVVGAVDPHDQATGIVIVPRIDGRLSKRGQADSDSDSDRSDRSAARSSRTEQDYAGRVRMLYKQSIASRTTDPEVPAIVSPMDVVEDLFKKSETVLPATWNLYRSALLWHLAQNRGDQAAYEEAYQRLARTRQMPKSVGKAKGPKKTISREHLNLLINTLGGMNRTTNWGAKVQYWLQAGLASGARPGEWFGANWLDDEQKILCIPNKKRKLAVPTYMMVSPGQTIHDVEADNPEMIMAGSKFDQSTLVRNVPIEDGDRLYINLHLGSLNDYINKVPNENPQARFDAYYNMCRKLLREACLRTFKGKNMYSLYVMRSQFAANMKAELPLEDVAALMGHEKTGKTTKSSYGPRRAAHKKTGISNRYSQENNTTDKRPEAMPFEKARWETPS